MSAHAESAAGGWLRRVLVVNPGADVYGSDLQMLESISALTGAGISVAVTCPNDGPLTSRLRDRGATVTVDTFPVVRRSYLSAKGVVHLGLDLARALPAMRSVLRSARPDLIYVNTTTIPWWIIAARVAGIPVVCHVHEAEDRDHVWVLRAIAAPLLFADRVLLISQTAARASWDVLPRLQRRSVIVLNGVPDRPEPVVVPPAGATVRLAVVGRLSPRKGPHVAIAALAELVSRGRDVTLEVAGSAFPGYEWYAESLREQAQRFGVSDRVEFTGYVTPSWLAFDRADIVIAPSVREPFGNAVVEAQLAQRPVVAAAAGGHLETVKDRVTGLHVPVEDVPALVAALEELIDDPAQRVSLGHQAREAAVRQFGIDRYRREILAALRDTPRGLRSRRRRGSERA
jgi:glycosyltransferase involved in cell wall biosynthesis